VERVNENGDHEDQVENKEVSLDEIQINMEEEKDAEWRANYQGRDVEMEVVPNEVIIDQPLSSQDLKTYLESLLLNLTYKAISIVEERKELMIALEQRKKKWIMWGKKNAKEDPKNKKFRKTWDIRYKTSSIIDTLNGIF
jgi:hypothetical protein